MACNSSFIGIHASEIIVFVFSITYSSFYIIVNPKILSQAALANLQSLTQSGLATRFSGHPAPGLRFFDRRIGDTQAQCHR